METLIKKRQANNDYISVLKMWQHDAEQNISSNEDYFTGNPFLLKILNQSPSVTWILDLRTQQYSFVSTGTTSLFGYDSINYINIGMEFHESIKHPDDTVNTWKLVHKIWEMLSALPVHKRIDYKFSLDYRIQKPDGRITRILEQNTILQQDKAGNITHLLGVCIDITQWKRYGTQLATLSSAADKKYFLFSSDTLTDNKPPILLSKRELEIVKLISEGRSSKYIADKLFISFHTVNTHRQKMIEKTKTKNTGELVQFAVCNGLI